MTVGIIEIPIDIPQAGFNYASDIFSTCRFDSLHADSSQIVNCKLTGSKTEIAIASDLPPRILCSGKKFVNRKQKIIIRLTVT